MSKIKNLRECVENLINICNHIQENGQKKQSRSSVRLPSKTDEGFEIIEASSLTLDEYSSALIKAIFIDKIDKNIYQSNIGFFSRFCSNKSMFPNKITFEFCALLVVSYFLAAKYNRNRIFYKVSFHLFFAWLEKALVMYCGSKVAWNFKDINYFLKRLINFSSFIESIYFEKCKTYGMYQLVFPDQVGFPGISLSTGFLTIGVDVENKIKNLSYSKNSHIPAHRIQLEKFLHQRMDFVFSDYEINLLMKTSKFETIGLPLQDSKRGVFNVMMPVKFSANTLNKSGTYRFVITQAGKVIFGFDNNIIDYKGKKRNYQSLFEDNKKIDYEVCSHAALCDYEPVISAGKVNYDHNKKVFTHIFNHSGHYCPDKASLFLAYILFHHKFKRMCRNMSIIYMYYEGRDMVFLKISRDKVSAINPSDHVFC